MRSDALLAFVPIGGNLSLVGAAGVGIPSTNTIDLLGSGVGTAPPNVVIGNTASTGFNSGNFGADVGVGRFKPQIAVFLNSAVTLTTGNSATLNIQFQGAQDPGAGSNYTPTTWQTFAETGYLTLAQLNATIAAATQSPVAQFDFPPSFPVNFAPRFLRLLFQPLATTNFTAGQVSSALVTLTQDQQRNKFAAKNFSVL
jgi:predicted Zn-dependent protease